jgi:hypothetical protein
VLSLKFVYFLRVGKDNVFGFIQELEIGAGNARQYRVKERTVLGFGYQVSTHVFFAKNPLHNQCPTELKFSFRFHDGPIVMAPDQLSADT